MNPAEPPSTNGLRYATIGVACVAVLLGILFMRFNAQVDLEREEAAERLALCQHLESVARATSTTSLESLEACKQLRKRYSESAAP
ncbi:MULTISPECIES: hypothetical protein [Pseudomonas]|jgi:hypothetical protein|uniref:General secretion pathway protein GspL n=1 Tax=Pseudomonas edaphica TaxID=2006980 RepID=A0A7Y7V831_9PSED|nr:MULTISPECIES: hypothetical protein [Pseudomonas]MCF5232866.1 hypothetical protein [Pseudomonas sp. PA-5-4H]MCF5236575.1 hypothetical protein [Pseudomonas sp. PA-5-4G]MCF5250564.1 hypothetical protein [Pseudomonas sp. PA-5-4B]MCF5254142.1 hypothetical protein [Pseudomonas sp. PA-5-4B]MCF5262895.1 hypothetical protein [Pseudomonas sp. PA-5-4A]